LKKAVFEGRTLKEGLRQRHQSAPEDVLRYQWMQVISNKYTLTPQEQMWAWTYAVTGSSVIASNRVGYNTDRYLSYMRRPNVAMTVDLARRELMKESKLDAEWIREYVMQILDFCPTDYMMPAEDGGWLMEPVMFDRMPREVKRLVEKVELRNIPRKGTYLAIEFISKTAALRIAAGFAAMEKMVTPDQVPWDTIAGGKYDHGEEDIEREIASVRLLNPPITQSNGVTNGHS
jgi:hypothetical protein